MGRSCGWSTVSADLLRPLSSAFDAVARLALRAKWVNLSAMKTGTEKSKLATAEMTSGMLSPLVSEFETEAQQASYTAWLNAKVRSSLEDPSPTIAHDQVMADARALLESKKQVRAGD